MRRTNWVRLWRTKDLLTVPKVLNYARNFHTTLETNSVHLNIEPKTCLHDEPVVITASGLQPSQKVTLTSSVRDILEHEFFSYAHYITDSNGELDVSHSSSLGGSYEGVFPMGHIACLTPSPKEHKYLRFFKRDIHVPCEVKVRILDGHLQPEEACEAREDKVLVSDVHRREYMAKGVERIPIEFGKVRGTLFLPVGDGPFPGVIDLFGSSGGLIEFRAAQLASRGIAAMALAYFGYKDLPSNLEDGFDLSYFEDAAKHMLSFDAVKSPHIGVVGVSKGGDLACSMGTFLDCVKAVVCINGHPVNTWGPLLVKGEKIDFVPFRPEKMIVMNPGLICSIDMLDDCRNYPGAHLPFHKSDADFLFLVSMDDQNWPTPEGVKKGVDRMKKEGFTRYSVIEYPEAGHLLEPPYSPFCEASYFKLAKAGLFWGGKSGPHCEAQVKAWDETLKFIKEKLA